MNSPRILEIHQNILNQNDALARDLRAAFAENGVFVINLVSGPGSGKTELLRRTLIELGSSELDSPHRSAAVTGDLATDNDAMRLAQSGAPVKQIVTGTLCHLEAELVASAIRDWELAKLDFLFIENVGNLVCPGDFDLGEDLRVLLLSTTEGEDKPLKYPSLLNTADVVVVNKMDLAEAAECDVDLLERNIRMVRPDAAIFKLSAKSGDGVGAWLDYLRSRLAAKRAGQP